jgi:hypothetical protein
MSNYNLNSKQVALIIQSLLNDACFYECDNKEYEKTVKKEGHELINFLLEQHNKQESETLKHYNNYVEGVN